MAMGLLTSLCSQSSVNVLRTCVRYKSLWIASVGLTLGWQFLRCMWSVQRWTRTLYYDYNRLCCPLIDVHRMERSVMKNSFPRPSKSSYSSWQTSCWLIGTQKLLQSRKCSWQHLKLWTQHTMASCANPRFDGFKIPLHSAPDISDWYRYGRCLVALGWIRSFGHCSVC